MELFRNAVNNNIKFNRKRLLRLSFPPPLTTKWNCCKQRYSCQKYTFARKIKRTFRPFAIPAVLNLVAKIHSQKCGSWMNFVEVKSYCAEEKHSCGKLSCKSCHRLRAAFLSLLIATAWETASFHAALSLSAHYDLVDELWQAAQTWQLPH